MSLLTDLIDSLLAMPGEFAAIAGHDPLAALMLAVGAVLVTVSVGYFGLLVLGSLLNLVTPSGGGRSYPPVR